jgi:Na+/H+-dicarboxylate symporter
MASPHPFLIKMLRSIGLIIGAGLAAIVVAKREKKGLGKEPPFKDFP